MASIAVGVSSIVHALDAVKRSVTASICGAAALFAAVRAALSSFSAAGRKLTVCFVPGSNVPGWLKIVLESAEIVRSFGTSSIQTRGTLIAGAASGVSCSGEAPFANWIRNATPAAGGKEMIFFPFTNSMRIPPRALPKRPAGKDGSAKSGGPAA